MFVLQCIQVLCLSAKKEYFDMYNEASLTPAVIEEAARTVLLPPAEVKMWFNHLASVERMQGKRQH